MGYIVAPSQASSGIEGMKKRWVYIAVPLFALLRAMKRKYLVVFITQFIIIVYGGGAIVHQINSLPLRLQCKNIVVMLEGLVLLVLFGLPLFSPRIRGIIYTNEFSYREMALFLTLFAGMGLIFFGGAATLMIIMKIYP